MYIYSRTRHKHAFTCTLTFARTCVHVCKIERMQIHKKLHIHAHLHPHTTSISMGQYIYTKCTYTRTSACVHTHRRMHLCTVYTFDNTCMHSRVVGGGARVVGVNESYCTHINSFKLPIESYFS